MPSTEFPNGRVLESSALSPDALLAALQPLVCSMLGMADADPARDTGVRLEWPQEGQPAWKIEEDICFLRATEEDADYSKIRDVIYAQNDLASVRQQITYQRTWRIHFTLYGPNCFDRSRLIIDALFLDWVHDSLASSRLALVTDVSRPVYAPELFQNRWWKRADFHVSLNELVSASIVIPSIASAEVLLETETGTAADIQIP